MRGAGVGGDGSAVDGVGGVAPEEINVVTDDGSLRERDITWNGQACVVPRSRV